MVNVAIYARVSTCRRTALQKGLRSTKDGLPAGPPDPPPTGISSSGHLPRHRGIANLTGLGSSCVRNGPFLRAHPALDQTPPLGIAADLCFDGVHMKSCKAAA